MNNNHSRLKGLHFFLFLAFFTLFTGALAADEFPLRPEPPRLVNDFSGTLTGSQAEALENKLDAFSRQTSTQIAIVMVKDLFGHDPGEYAFTLAEKWGIGQKGKNNGILILVKPKTNDGQLGRVFIAVGYGLEGVVPDAIASRTIVNAEIMPSFKANDYYTGLDRATSVLMSLTKGEFTADQYEKKISKPSVFPGFALILLVFVIFMVFNRNKYRTVGAEGSSTGSLLGSLWWLSMLGGNRGGGGSWGNFSGGGGGSSGGFGGFGGGSFGGGGAGGSW